MKAINKINEWKKFLWYLRSQFEGQLKMPTFIQFIKKNHQIIESRIEIIIIKDIRGIFT